MYLIYDIDKCLCVFPKEGADCVTRIVTRKNGLDEGGELMQSECASDQTSTGCELRLRRRIKGKLVFHMKRQKRG